MSLDAVLRNVRHTKFFKVRQAGKAGFGSGFLDRASTLRAVCTTDQSRPRRCSLRSPLPVVPVTYGSDSGTFLYSVVDSCTFHFCDRFSRVSLFFAFVVSLKILITLLFFPHQALFCWSDAIFGQGKRILIETGA